MDPFTPGPWHVVIDDTGGPFTGWPSISAAPELDLTVIHRGGFKQEFWGDVSQRVAIANATLIAAAPDLYAALQWALPLAEMAMESHRLERLRCGHTFGTKRIGLYDEEVQQIEDARAAFAKARG